MAVTFGRVFSQFDSAYSQALLGFNTANTYNLYNYGCLITSLATILCYFGKDETPLTVNDKLKSLGPDKGFGKDGGAYVWGSISKLFPDIKEKRVDTPDKLTDEQMAEIKSALDRKLPVMVEIDYKPATVERDMHFVILTAYNPNDENDFTIADPLGGKTATLRQYLAWLKPSARITIRQYAIYEGPLPAETTPLPTPTTPATTPTVSTPPASSGETVIVKKLDNERNVKMASQYKEVVGYLELEKPPEDAMFEDVRRVIAGIKSNATDYWNKKEAAEKALEVMKVELKAKEDEISRQTEEMTRREKLHKAELEAVKQTTPTPQDFVKQFWGVYEELKGKYDKAVERITELTKKLAEKKVEEKNDPSSVPATGSNSKSSGNSNLNLIQRLIAWFTELED